MKDSGRKLILILLCIVIFQVYSLSYDYAASIECLAEPPRPQYEGGLIDNPEFNNGLEGWLSFGHGKGAKRTSESGNHFLIVYQRKRPYHSVSKKVYLQEELLYTFSAWVQVNEGDATVRVVFKTDDGFIHAGAVKANSGCWSMLKGGLTVRASGPAEFYFERENTTGEIWVDSVSLQPFTKDEWRAHQARSIDKTRKKTVRFQAVDVQGNSLAGATISLKQTRPGFPFGCAIAKTILNNAAYQNWFTSRFTVTTFENEMKWYSTEIVQGKEDYSAPDAMVTFAKDNNIAIRGHNVFWDDPTTQQDWVRSLSTSELWNATGKRLNSLMWRYKGQLIAWDVVNENLHFSSYENSLGKDASNIFYQKAHRVDPDTPMFLNDYNTLEQPEDPASTPGKYLEKLKEIQSSYPENYKNMAIGLEGHFGKPNIPYMRSTLDTLAKANVPIWLTDVDVRSDPNQVSPRSNQSPQPLLLNLFDDKANYLEEILREAFSHPAVQGIVIWAAWHPEGCYVMCLTDNNFKNLQTGDVVDKLLAEWRSIHVVGKADSDGFFQIQIFQGEYEMKITHPTVNSSSVQILKVEPRSLDGVILRVHV